MTDTRSAFQRLRRGRLVGVPTAGVTANDSLGPPVAGSIGLGFAIPVHTTQRISAELIVNGRVQNGSFGVQVAPVTTGTNAVKAAGLSVIAVSTDGPGAGAGLQRGDILTPVDSRVVASSHDLQEVSMTRVPGTSVVVVCERDGASTQTSLTLGEAP